MIRLEARPYREKRIAELTQDVSQCETALGRKPKLRVIIVGDHPASVLYVSNKEKLAAEIGMDAATLSFPETATPEEIAGEVKRLNEDASVDGILIQRPLPKSFREEDVLLWIHPSKDVDAFHPETVGRMILGLPGFIPCTPAGCLKLLAFYGYELSGKICCVVGRSSIVGKPLAQLLLAKDATVFHCHSRTNNLASITSQADFLFVATGKPEMIRSEHVKPGAVVIDIGIGKNADGKTVGDVNYEDVSKVAAGITPVPGGIGPMTILGLLENTLESAKRKL
jgi:methylenetetrahydrofolate dehydrogenase (NADP+) / methenyltetrahydrofolate cyclohydrolase